MLFNKYIKSVDKLILISLSLKSILILSISFLKLKFFDNLK